MSYTIEEKALIFLVLDGTLKLIVVNKLKVGSCSFNSSHYGTNNVNLISFMQTILNTSDRIKILFSFLSHLLLSSSYKFYAP